MHGRPRGLAILAAVVVSVIVRTASASTLGGWLGLPQPLEAAAAELGGAFANHAPLATSDRPHPAVARIIVPEGDTAISYGSGTLVDVRDQFGLVVTNWHVVRDGTGEVEVVFPNGFKSKARPLKVDEDWDLAALVIWRPPVEPVKIAAAAPQPGDVLTICGYGSGQYRAATGRCTQYYSPATDLPQHMVELDVEARQGDSGGPILNDRGELAGVLFGAGRGTTLGSFGGRVESFLVSLAPDIGRPSGDALAAHSAAPATQPLEQASAPSDTQLLVSPDERAMPSATITNTAAHADFAVGPAAVQVAQSGSPASNPSAHVESRDDQRWHGASAVHSAAPPAVNAAVASGSFAGLAKNVLAAVGVLALIVQALRLAR
jgi:S1-C subfamily serine protease